MSKLHYKGYAGSVEYSIEDQCFFGSILGIRDLVTYEGKSVQELERAFHEMVNLYLSEKKFSHSTIGKDRQLT